MTNVRGRRSGAGSTATGAARRSGARVVTRPTGPVSTGPVRAGMRSAAASRPGRRTTRRLGRGGRRAAHRPLFTGRAVLLSALVLLLALTLAGPLRQFLAGRADLVQLAAERTQLEQRAQQLQTQLDQQADPAYQERQARDRLTYVLPGDRLVVVVDGQTAQGDAGTLAPDPSGPSAHPPWYQGLLDSVATADGSP
jgi:cell division protein FtsB